jgi:hypothetical protein
LRAQRHYADLLRSCTGVELAQIFADFAFLIGHNPRLRIMMVPPDMSLLADDLRLAEDEQALHAAVLRHEGTTSLQHLRHWLQHQPTAFKVVRRPSGEVTAFMAALRIDLATAAQRDADPIVLAIWDYAIRLLGDAPRGPVIFGRFAMSCDTYQDLSPELALCWNWGARALFLPGLKLGFGRLREGRQWEPLTSLAGARFVPELQHEVDGRTYEVTLQDHRAITPANWVSSMLERLAVGDWQEPPPARPEQPSLAALSRKDFAACVRKALRMLGDPIALAENPLIHSHVVRARTSQGADSKERAAALRTLLCEEIEALRGTPRGDRWHRVLVAAYVDPVGKHESAARELNIPYGTFRRHKDKATQYLVEILWERDCAHS